MLFFFNNWNGNTIIIILFQLNNGQHPFAKNNIMSQNVQNISLPLICPETSLYRWYNNLPKYVLILSRPIILFAHFVFLFFSLQKDTNYFPSHEPTKTYFLYPLYCTDYIIHKCQKHLLIVYILHVVVNWKEYSGEGNYF